MNSDARRYPTKVDAWIVMVLVGTVLGSLLVLLLIPRGDAMTSMIAFSSVAGVWLISFPFMWPVRYTIADGMLIVQIGVIRRNVPLSSILAVESQPELTGKRLVGIKAAYSIDRLLITTDQEGLGKNISISPTDKRMFLEDLRGRDPGLRFVGEDLRRDS